MRPRVIADFVSFCDLALKNCRVLFNTLAEHEECKLDVPLRRHIKQLRGAGCVRAIIEGHRDIRSVDVHVGERDFLSDSFLGGGPGGVAVLSFGLTTAIKTTRMVTKKRGRLIILRGYSGIPVF